MPDDVIVNFTDDNWGNVRKLADRSSRPVPVATASTTISTTSGRSQLQWVDTDSLTNIWDQLHETASYGKQNLWVTNVGDLKGDEMPTSSSSTTHGTPIVRRSRSSVSGRSSTSPRTSATTCT